MQREAIEQQHTVQWHRLKYPNVLIVASANGGSRNVVEAKNLKKSGVFAGFPDLFIPKAARGFHGLMIEMKAPKGNDRAKGRVTKLQHDCLIYLNGQGYHAVVAWGFEEARKIIDWYLNEKAND